MTAADLLYAKALKLPAPLQTEALHYVEFLCEKASAPTGHGSEPEALALKTPEQRAKITTSPITGLPVIETGGPIITSEMVREALADFP